MLKQLAEASNDPAMLQRAQQTANYTTYYLQPDNRIVVGFDLQTVLVQLPHGRRFIPLLFL